MTTFADLGLSPEILRAIEDRGYTTPTPIQEQAIPYVLQMRDVLGCAQTGTGKTAGFTLPMIEILANGRARARMPRSLILEPTRELATQVAESFREYGKYHKQLNMALLIGGENMAPQISNLDRGVDVLIATPGRMIDLFERGKILLTDIKIFVIDEADRMLDMGFIPDIEKIASMLPPMRQTLFFSATMPPEIRKLADRFLKNPKSISVAPPATTAANVSQILIDLPSGDDWQKREALRLLLKRENVQNAFIFCNRKRDVALLHKSLQKHGFNAGALHGDLDQSTRTATLDSFRNNAITFLVCSDVAARGLDIADVSHVFNFDVPFNAEDYVHRIGRTGRAGKNGAAYTFVTPDDAKLVAAIETLIKLKIPREVLADLPEPSASLSKRPPRAKKPHGAKRAHAPHAKDPHRRDSHHVKGQRHDEPPKLPAQHPHESSPAKVTHKPPANQETRTGHGFGDNLPAFLRHPRAGKRSA
ncbi:MAG: DEAD/DEAH box helicase [Alphaproteobacteria bacterium]|nr:DEAD/DEAH box helicase [Alphaproteobacteria bacterium]